MTTWPPLLAEKITEPPAVAAPPSPEPLQAVRLEANYAGTDGRPILFLHIPKTAGTAFLVAIHNVFGDYNVLRLSMDDLLLKEIAAIENGERPIPACVNGHPPIYFWKKILHRFQPFTILRDPIARVQSLFRFIRREPESTLKPWGLPPELSFKEFISSRNRGLFEHMSNGMCRMLSGDPRFNTPGGDDFEEPERYPELFTTAVRMLETCTLGLTEDMENTLRLAQAQWGVPFTIKNVVANTTERIGEEYDIDSIRQISQLNTLDIALYDQARTIFQQRLRELDQAPVTTVNPRSIFVPTLNEWVPAGLVPGRQAFHSIEPTGVCWLDADRSAQIHFSTPRVSTRLSIVFQCAYSDYPVTQVVLEVDGQPVRHHVWKHKGDYVTILTEALPSGGDLRVLTIKPPVSISMRVLQPEGKDRRFLSLALSQIAFLT